MAQIIGDSFGCPDTARMHNDHLVKIMPPGVYQGLTVGYDGTIAAGVALTEQGVRIEETTSPGKPLYGDQWQYSGVPSNLGQAQDRYDLVVLRYLWEAIIPVPTATYRVIQGTPGAGYPSIPNDGHTYLILAWCYAAAGNGSGSWDNVIQAGPPERLFNCSRTRSGTYTVGNRNFGATRLEYNPDGSYFVLSMVDPFTYTNNGDTIDWGDPVLTIRKNQIDEFISQVAGKSGAAKIGVAADQTSGLAAGTLQAVLQALKTAINNEALARDEAIDDEAEAREQAASNVANNLASQTDSALGAALIGLAADAGSGLTAGTLRAKMIALFTGLFTGHTTAGAHVSIDQVVTARSTSVVTIPTLLWKSAYAAGGECIRFYSTNDIVNGLSKGMKSLLISFNAAYNYTANKWAPDDSAYGGHIFTVGPGGVSLEVLGTLSGGCFTESALIYNMDSTDGMSIMGGPAVQYGTGEPPTSPTPSPGAMWHRTDAATGHSGVYVYNYYSGWGELALVS